MSAYLPALNQVVIHYPEVDLTGRGPRYQEGTRRTFTADPGTRLDAWLAEHNGTRRLLVTFQRIGPQPTGAAPEARVLLDLVVENAVLAGFNPDEVLWTGFALDPQRADAGHRFVRVGFKRSEPHHALSDTPDPAGKATRC